MSDISTSKVSSHRKNLIAEPRMQQTTLKRNEQLHNQIVNVPKVTFYSPQRKRKIHGLIDDDDFFESILGQAKKQFHLEESSVGQARTTNNSNYQFETCIEKRSENPKNSRSIKGDAHEANKRKHKIYALIDDDDFFESTLERQKKQIHREDSSVTQSCTTLNSNDQFETCYKRCSGNSKNSKSILANVNNFEANKDIGLFDPHKVNYRKTTFESKVQEQSELPRHPIPVGPRFQAELPNWTCSGVYKKQSTNDKVTNNLKWLGTRIWPIEDGTIRKFQKKIGVGRSERCPCDSRGSSVCIKLHIDEERQKLKHDVGVKAFLSWRFDDMGESMTESWTFKQRRGFDLLVKTSLQANGISFWTQALKIFRSTSEKVLSSYYFNVYIPRRLGIQTRLCLQEIDTDDEHASEDDMESRDGFGNGGLWRHLRCLGYDE